MPDLGMTLPPQVELGAVRKIEYSTDVITTDGGYEVRNARWSRPLRTFEISFPTATRDDAVYTAVKALYTAAVGSLYSFNFTDWTVPGGEVVTVRFDTTMAITGVDVKRDHIETLTLKEVRE